VSISSGLSSILTAIECDFVERFPGYHKSRREGLALLSSVMLESRSANLMELAAALPRDIGSKDHRYQYISRVLANSHIDCDEIMRGYATEVFARLSEQGQTIVLMMDQSHINDVNEVLMLSVRIGERALPVAWRVRETQGNIGFVTQKDLLDAVKEWLPENSNVMLVADRFYGTANLIGWCQATQWSYRIRLKGNLTLQHEGGEITTGEVLKLSPEGLEKAELYGSGVLTNIGVLHEKGHREPWIIAMDSKPNKYKTLDYGLRWGIEPMFSDFKSRGFGLAQSQIQKPERLGRLILIMTIAMYWAVSCGTAEQRKIAESGVKRGFKNNSDHCAPCSNKG
jgi:hypothetical protein